MRRLPLALAAAVLFTAGCDLSSDNLLGEFRANATVNGAVRTGPDDDAVDLRGEAVYTVVETERGREFVIGLYVDDLLATDYDDLDFILFRYSGDIPPVGGYAVDDEASGPNVVSATYADVEEADDPLEATGTVLRGTDGTLAITNVDPYGFIAGSFRFSAEGIDLGSLDAADGAFEGQFEARYESPDLVFNRGINVVFRL